MNNAVCELCGTGEDTCDGTGAPISCVFGTYWMNSASCDSCVNASVATCDSSGVDATCTANTHWMNGTACEG